MTFFQSTLRDSWPTNAVSALIILGLALSSFCMKLTIIVLLVTQEMVLSTDTVRKLAQIQQFNLEILYNYE